LTATLALRWLSLLPALMVALLSSACAGSRVGEAEVRLQQGVPCFGVTAAEAADAPTLVLHALQVHDLAVQPPLQVWSLLWRRPAPTLPLGAGAGACVPFGPVPPGWDGAAAQPLQPGRAYHVYLNAAPEVGPRRRHGYDARFCLQASPQGPQVQPLPPSSTSCRP
jgi:hypothetical protein